MSGTTVIIVGGGFCGTLAAIRLLTGPQRGGCSLPPGSRIQLIEPGRPGPGLAYRAGPDFWRLNVPVGRMSAFAERPLDFLEWARRRDPEVREEDFLPRTWYGEYLTERLDEAHRLAASRVRLDHVRGRAVEVEPAGGRAQVWLDDGTALAADRVLLALGNSRDATPLPGIDPALIVADGLYADWLQRLPLHAPRVLLVGTGLTMIDVALALSAARQDARMLAISRHGLLPRTQGLAHRPAHVPPVQIAELVGHGPLHRRVARFRAYAAALAAGGGDWRDGVQAVRESLPGLWRAAPRQDRTRFLRHLRSFWDVHRHRVPTGTWRLIEKLQESGRLRVEAARVVEAEQANAGVRVAWRKRGWSTTQVERFDAVVNVTGPDGDPRRSRQPLVQSLLARGLARPDDLGLGWQVDDHGRLLAADGSPSPLIHYVGPQLRAQCWEATAVPELRTHVDRTTDAIAAGLQPSQGNGCQAPHPAVPERRLTPFS